MGICIAGPEVKYCVCGTRVVTGRGTQTVLQLPRSMVIGRHVVTGT